MTATPPASPVTRPVPLTVTRLGSEDDHVTGLPRSLLLASNVVAVSCWVAPTAMVAVVGVTPTLATGTGATTIGIAVCAAPEVAVRVVCPGATPVTPPLALTVAIEAEPVDQLTLPVPIGAPN